MCAEFMFASVSAMSEEAREDVELQGGMHCLMKVLETELRSSVRTASALNCKIIFPALT